MSKRQREGNPIYETSVISDIALSAVISVGFFIYGWLLFWRAKSSDDASTSDKKRELFKVHFLLPHFISTFY
jgi:hypothetical protein